jgi:hypothetical protein
MMAEALASAGISSKFFVRFSAEGIGSVSVLKDGEAPQIQGGYGGWEVVARARQRGLTQWTGVEPKRISVPILFDGLHNGNGQEDEVAKLLKMATPDPHEPPVVHLSGKGYPEIAVNWVIEDITWGSNVIWGTDRQGKDVLLRQDAVVHLMQHVAGDRTAFSAAKSTRVGGRVWPKHYTVKKGDTIQKIASKFYGSSKKWKLIANANNIRDPKHIKTGRVLIIPKP